MCEICGCGQPGIEGHSHDLSHGHSHEHGQANAHSHSEISFGEEVLAANNRLAAQNRDFFEKNGLYAVNIMGSPGSGKTSLLELLARQFGDTMAVIEGDLQTRRDSERIIRAGSRAYQIETNGACHLDAHSVMHAAAKLELDGCRLLVIENVGNLVCPVSYNLGEHEKIAILSLPEGDDKVLKYPSLFHRISTLIINKTDLAPYLSFDAEKAVNECRSLNRAVTVFQLSAQTGEGVDAFCVYLAQKAGIE